MTKRSPSRTEPEQAGASPARGTGERGQIGLVAFGYMLGGIIATELLAAPFLTVLANEPQLRDAVGQVFMPAGNLTIFEAALNSLWLIAIVLAETAGIYLIFRYGRRFLRHVLLAVSALPLLSITLLMLAALRLPDVATLLVILGLLVSVALLAPRLRLLSGALTIMMSAEIGALLGCVLTPPTLFILPLALSLYDIYTVLKGPLGAVASNVDPRDFGLLMFRVGERGLGAGDLVFYSTMTTAGLLQSGLLGALAVGTAVNVGAIATFAALRRYERPLPALPISMAFGVSALYLL